MSAFYVVMNNSYSIKVGIVGPFATEADAEKFASFPKTTRTEASPGIPKQCYERVCSSWLLSREWLDSPNIEWWCVVESELTRENIEWLVNEHQRNEYGSGREKVMGENSSANRIQRGIAVSNIKSNKMYKKIQMNLAGEPLRRIKKEANRFTRQQGKRYVGEGLADYINQKVW